MIDAAIMTGDIKNKHLDSASSLVRKRDSFSSLSSGKASIQLSKSPKPEDDQSIGEATPERTLSSSTAPITPENQTPRSSNEKKPIPANEMSDFDIIADIIANATAAASSKSGTYSSFSSGKASISTESNLTSTASTPTLSNRRSTLNSFFGGATSRSKSETTMTMLENKPRSLFNTSSIFGGKKRPESEEEKELKDAGVTVKEIKSTLGKLVVPREIANPMPQVKLEAPQHAKLNR